MKKTMAIMVLMLFTVGMVAVSAAEYKVEVGPKKVFRGLVKHVDTPSSSNRGTGTHNYKMYETVFTSDRGANSCYDHGQRKNIAMGVLDDVGPRLNPQIRNCDWTHEQNNGRNFKQAYNYWQPSNHRLKEQHRLDPLTTFEGFSRNRELHSYSRLSR